MEFKKPPKPMIMILGKNLRSFYTSIYIDQNDKLRQILGEDFKSEIGTKFTSQYKEIESGDNFSLYCAGLSKKARGYDTKKEGDVFFLKNEKNGLVYVFTNQNKEFLRTVVAPFFHHEYPDIFHFIYSSRELRNVLHFIEDFLHTTLFSERVSEKRIYGEQAETRVEYKQGDYPPFRLIFEKAKEEKLWVDWIKIRTEEELSYKFSLCREGRFRFISGDISDFIQILQKFGEIGLEKNELLSNREIKENEEPQPLVLKYNQDIFSEKEEREGLIETFSGYKRCSYSVLHEGNPHIYMYVSDKMDQSSYSIRNVSNSELMISPQTSSSSGSLMRLIDFLSSDFMDPFEIEEM